MILLVPSMITLAVAHGRMYWPFSRQVPGDSQNGYTIARGRSFTDCANLPPSPVLTPPLTSGPATIEYLITAPHGGDCIVYIDKEYSGTWVEIGRLNNCWQNKIGSINVVIPPGEYTGVIRWFYMADNNPGHTGDREVNEMFNTCADIVVKNSGTNDHPVVAYPPLKYDSCTDGSVVCVDDVTAAACLGGFWYSTPCLGSCSSGVCGGHSAVPPAVQNPSINDTRQPDEKTDSSNNSIPLPAPPSSEVEEKDMEVVAVTPSASNELAKMEASSNACSRPAIAQMPTSCDALAKALSIPRNQLSETFNLDCTKSIPIDISICIYDESNALKKRSSESCVGSVAVFGDKNICLGKKR